MSTKYDKESKAAGDHAKSALEREMKYKKVDRDNSDDRYVRTDADHLLIEGGTRLADGVGDAQPYMPLHEFKEGGGRFADVHYDRNKYNDPSKATVLMPKDKSVFHMQGPNGEGNKKYISSDGRHEAVYRADGTLDVSDLNGGTYNYASPDRYPKTHLVVDVIPYVLRGNSSDDPSTLLDRIYISKRALKKIK